MNELRQYGLAGKRPPAIARKACYRRRWQRQLAIASIGGNSPIFQQTLTQYSQNSVSWKQRLLTSTKRIDREANAGVVFPAEPILVAGRFAACAVADVLVDVEFVMGLEAGDAQDVDEDVQSPVTDDRRGVWTRSPGSSGCCSWRRRSVKSGKRRINGALPLAWTLHDAGSRTRYIPGERCGVSPPVIWTRGLRSSPLVGESYQVAWLQ
jgi:hypothetical protein